MFFTEFNLFSKYRRGCKNVTVNINEFLCQLNHIQSTNCIYFCVICTHKNIILLFFVIVKRLIQFWVV